MLLAELVTATVVVCILLYKQEMPPLSLKEISRKLGVFRKNIKPNTIKDLKK
jgi:biotin operon repressor